MCYRMYCILYMARVSLDYKLSTSRIRNEVMQRYVWFMKASWLMWLNFVLALVTLGYPQQNKHIQCKHYQFINKVGVHGTHELVGFCPGASPRCSKYGLRIVQLQGFYYSGFVRPIQSLLQSSIFLWRPQLSIVGIVSYGFGCMFILTDYVSRLLW